GARAAALGGFTAVVAMPNTQPPLDDAAVVASVLAAGREAMCDVVAAGCITKGRGGEELAPMGELHALGVRIFTDDGACVSDAGVMRRALEYARSLPGAVVAQHAEDAGLAAGGHMHEGAWSSRLGIPGRPAAGTIDAIATDHAPHVPEAKERTFEDAPPGMLGLETALALTLSELVEPGVLSLHDALARLSWQPAAIAGLDGHGGPIEPGRPANLCVFDPAVRWEVDPRSEE